MPNIDFGKWVPWLLLLVVVGFYTFGGGGNVPDGDKDQDRQEQYDAAGSAVIIVYEQGDLDKYPYVATLQAQADYWDKLKANGVYWHFYDDEAEEIETYRSDALAAGLPALMVIKAVDGKGKVLRAVKCPETTPEIDKVLAETFK